MQLVGDTIHKLRPRLFQQVCITELITWSFYTLCISKPTSWTFTFKYKLYLTYYNKILLSFSLKELRKMQHRAALWVLGTFCTSLTLGIEAIADLILIYLHLQKLSERHQLRTSTLLSNHAIKSLLESRHINKFCSHCFLMEFFYYLRN